MFCKLVKVHRIVEYCKKLKRFVDKCEVTYITISINQFIRCGSVEVLHKVCLFVQELWCYIVNHKGIVISFYTTCNSCVKHLLPFCDVIVLHVQNGEKCTRCRPFGALAEEEETSGTNYEGDKNICQSKWREQERRRHNALKLAQWKWPGTRERKIQNCRHWEGP